MVEREPFSHVYWLGGSPCSGKSTIASMICDKYGFTAYQCDTHYDNHLCRIVRVRHPVMAKIRDLTWQKLWFRPIEQQIDEEWEFYKEEFAMITEDILALPKITTLLVEGAAAIPEKVSSLLSSPRRAVWVVPTPSFQIEHYSQREWVRDIINQCNNPEVAFQNWMNRDIGFAERVATQALECGFTVIEVDGRQSVLNILARVEKHFELDT